jgi:predicted AAA+ superfamily ATPase
METRLFDYLISRQGEQISFLTLSQKLAISVNQVEDLIDYLASKGQCSFVGSGDSGLAWL